jgi:hypothetical protein
MLHIAFYKSKHGRLIDKLISLVSFSKYSHCEIVFSDGMCASSSYRDGGVRFKKIEMNEKWDVFCLQWENGDFISGVSEFGIREWFKSRESDSYDWIGAIGCVIGVDITSPDRKYCSYTCATVLGLDPTATPGGLYRMLIKEGMIR